VRHDHSGVWQRFVTNRAISPQVIQSERIINQLFGATRLQRRSLDPPFIVIQVIERKDAPRCALRVSIGKISKWHFVVNRCHIPIGRQRLTHESGDVTRRRHQVLRAPARCLKEKFRRAQPRRDDVEILWLVSLISSSDNAGQHVCKLNASRL
jgi:hypothetical protein